MCMNKSNNWDNDEKDNARRFNLDSTSYSGSYPYLPKKVTVVIVAFAILMFVGIVNGLMNPGPPIFPTTEQLEAMSCLELQEFIEKNIDYKITGMSYWVEEATLEFLNECSSYGN